MIRLLFILIFCFAAPVPDRPRISPEGVFKGVPLKGRVKVVKGIADFLVKVKDRGQADLRVMKITAGNPKNIGEWKFVTVGEDFTVRFVDHCEDFTIRYVNLCPGVPTPFR